MEKTGINHIVCSKCSKAAVTGTNPPYCIDHINNTEKQAEQTEQSLREFTNNPGDIFNG